MNGAAVWWVTVLLVSASVIAEGYLAWVFIRDWRIGRAEERGQLRRPKQNRAVNVRATTARTCVFASAVVAALGMNVGVALGRGSAAPRQFAAAANQINQPEAVPPGSTFQPAMAAPAAAPMSALDNAVGSAISVQLYLDFTNAYFYRGIRQQDHGLIVQPSARITSRFLEEAALTLDGFIGMWNSAGPNAGMRFETFIEVWYESDLFAGFTLTRGQPHHVVLVSHQPQRCLSDRAGTRLHTRVR